MPNSAVQTPREPQGNEVSLLVLNGGSSSLKFALYRADSPAVLVASGNIDRVGAAESIFTFRGLAGSSCRTTISAPDHRTGLEAVLDRLACETGVTEFGAVGHRVVHGGPHYFAPQLVDEAMLRELRRILPLNPQHLPFQIALMEAVTSRFPTVPQVACFDTAFHSTMPRVAKLLPIPRRFEAQGVQRYGFHGLSYAYLMQELERVAGATAARGRIILAHLGNGASMAAVHEGRSIDTTMAFTPAAGLVMSTRSGDLDPGLVTYLARSEQLTMAQLDQLFSRESGLLGVSQTSSDMRDLLAREGEDVRAAEAVALFCYQAKKWLGAFVAALGGLDTLVFAGGIGENAAAVRERICLGLDYLGIELDPAHNAAHAAVISRDSSRVTVRVMRTDEEAMIVRSICELVDVGVVSHDSDHKPEGMGGG